MTTIEKIREMSIDELTSFLKELDAEGIHNYCDTKYCEACDITNCKSQDKCTQMKVDTIKWWLSSEVDKKKYTEKDVLNALPVLLPEHAQDKLEIIITENILADNDEERYAYEINQIDKKGRKRWLSTFGNRIIRQALTELDT